MTINELLECMNNDSFDLYNELQIKKYLPLEIKKTIAQGIIFECTSNEYGAIKVDSVQRHLSYVKYMLTMYTNLEYTDDDYDTLCSTEFKNTSLLDAIIECFKLEAQECEKIIGFMIDDYMYENSIESVAVMLMNKLSASLGDISEKINEKIGDVDINSILPDDVDKEKLSKFLNNYIN